MKLTYLISCMHQKDVSIIERTGVHADVVVVNQCDHNSIEEFDFISKKGKLCHAKFICTTERGLSNSRNMAIRYADGDICQVCDDDQTVTDDGEDVICEAYKKHSDASVICFALIREDCDKKYLNQEQIMSFKQILRTNSLQITFRRKDILEKGIQFDNMLGSGTGNGGGEENKFLFDCKNAGLKLHYHPEIIGTVLPSDSQWFKGYTEQFMRNQGWASRRILGSITGFLYCFHYGVFHINKYDKDMNVLIALRNLYVGFFEKR